MRAQIGPLTSVVVITGCVGLSWLATFVLGGAGHVAPHWFYVPILVATVRFGLPGALISSVASGLVAGPLTPLDVASGTAQDLSDWTSRAGFFLGNGLIMAAVIGRLRTALVRELAVATEERDLARHKEAIIRTVSHEFRTPLTVMRGTVDTLARRHLVVRDARPLVASLDRAVWRLDNLVRVVVATSQALLDRRTGGDTSVELHELCQRAAGPSRAARVRLDFEPGGEIITGDAELLGVLIHAIVDNALKFSPPETPVGVSSRRTADAIEIRVRDAGPGIRDAYAEHAFEPFTQQDESDSRPEQGLGVGLFAAQKILELMGGEIALLRADGGGTEVAMTIPQRRDDDQAKNNRHLRASA
jgi:signal transduction histidine kinase